MYTGYEHVPTHILEKAAIRGTKVHALCAGIAKGHWIPDGMIGEDLLGYVQSFRQWSDEHVDEYLIVEKRYSDEELGYTGQVDFVIKGKDGKSYLVDLKTSAIPQKTHAIQMAAYERLLWKENIIVTGAILVYLSKEGEYPKLNRLDEMCEERKIFYSALECWKYFNKRKGNGKKAATNGN